MHSKPHAKNLRKGRCSEAYRIYLVTAVARARTPVLHELRAARTLVAVLREEQARGRAETLAYTIMPDPLHWLLQLGDGNRLSRVVSDVKSVAAHRLGRPIWQRGFHDHAVRSDEDLRGLARYVVANPLRAGLVQRLGDDPHWDAVWL